MALGSGPIGSGPIEAGPREQSPYVGSVKDLKELPRRSQEPPAIIKAIQDVVGSRSDSPTASAPRMAEFLLYCFLSKEDRTAVIGDLSQEYQTVLLPKFGPRGAKVWYWSQVIRSIVPVVFNFLSKLRKLGH